MFKKFPATLDPWRMVSARQSFRGRLPFADMGRLLEVLAAPEGEADYQLDFDRDEWGKPYVNVAVQAPLTLLCQRTLQPFVLPVALETRLGLLREEAEEAALLPGCEPLLVIDDRIHPAAVIEDELLLAVPLVPVSPRSQWPEEGLETPAPEAPVESEQVQDNPFAVLRELQRK